MTAAQPLHTEINKHRAGMALYLLEIANAQPAIQSLQLTLSTGLTFRWDWDFVENEDGEDVKGPSTVKVGRFGGDWREYGSLESFAEAFELRITPEETTTTADAVKRLFNAKPEQARVGIYLGEDEDTHLVVFQPDGTIHVTDFEEQRTQEFAEIESACAALAD